MSELSQKLREALKDYEDKLIYPAVREVLEETLLRSIPALLTEYEKLEREAEACVNIRNELKERLSKMESNKEVLPPEFFSGYRQAYAEMNRTADHIYRTDCGEEK